MLFWRLFELKAYGYLRSVGQGLADQYEMIRQEAVIKEYAQVQSIEVIEIFRDDIEPDILQERHGLAKMMLSIERDEEGVDTILIEELCRLSHSITVQEMLIQDFRSKRCNVVSVTENTDRGKDAFIRELTRQTLLEIRQYDKEIILLRSKVAREFLGEIFGHMHSRRAGETISSEIIEEMKKLRRHNKGSRRMSYRRIADKMNENGYTNLNGGKFTAVDVAYYINRREYQQLPQVQQLAPLIWKD
jgi:DNA invertase Pin-like site-specific DNA recombinase